jgi:hypothetical protein
MSPWKVRSVPDRVLRFWRGRPNRQNPCNPVPGLTRDLMARGPGSGPGPAEAWDHWFTMTMS